MSRPCTLCGSDIDRHDPVFVVEEREGDRVEAGQFCNYACLTAYVDEEDLTVGAACEFDPEGAGCC